ncbi:hypothetical protein [Streptosporangium sp. NBC_01756]|uniref:hypothetical protein n=1 Tax=Streptosporangium sp. NBC_01756 TaxID=2975950 RepID=UPI002DDA6534|nr:hypothetical protein [Streptosporangium sp. NBC_01756]WSC88943.1 DUF11 domain-containing protein [Streptosporangium sp. NBC_01756]
MSSTTSTAPGRTRRISMVSGVLLALLAAVGLAGPQPAAADDTTITIGQPGHITLTAPKTVAPGDEALLDLNYTNTSGRTIGAASLTITFAPEADSSLDVGSLSWWSPDPEGHTQTATGDSATRTVTVGWSSFDPGDTNRTVVYLPFKNTASGSVPLHATLTENFDDGPVPTDLGDLTINAIPPAADLAVSLNASPKNLGVLYATFTATVKNQGPAAATAARLRFTYPRGFAQPSAPGCTVNTSARTATCDLGALPAGGSVTRTLGLHTQLLTISNHLTVTAARLDSTPADPQPANDAASATCSAITGLLVRC